VTSLQYNIARTLGERPDERLVEFEEHWYTRGDLRRLVDAIEAQLSAAGLGPGSRIGLVIRNDAAHLGAFLGLIARRRCAALITPFQEPERLAGEIRTQRMHAIIASARDWSPAAIEAAREVGTLGLQLSIANGLQVAPVEGAPAGEAARQPPVEHAIELLTSGTSGPPKRNPFGHATLDQAVRDQIEMARNMGDAPQDVLIQYAPMASISGCWNALQCGNDGQRMVMLEKFAVAPWHRALKLYRPRFAALPPAMLRMVFEADLPKDDLACLRGIRVGSAPIDVQTKRRFQQEYGIPLLMIYGATEYAGPFCAWSQEDFARYGAAKEASTGRILRHMAQVRIVSLEDGSELPTGQNGRLEVQLPRVGPDWISTNDLASVDADGFLYIQGRADDAIIRGGFKIPPDTIAAALRAHPSVRDVAVLGLPHPRLGEVPVAAVELRPGSERVDEAQLLAFVRKSLIAYQVPVAIRVVDALPRTELAKIHRPGVRALFADFQPA